MDSVAVWFNRSPGLIFVRVRLCEPQKQMMSHQLQAWKDALPSLSECNLRERSMIMILLRQINAKISRGRSKHLEAGLAHEQNPTLVECQFDKMPGAVMTRE